MFLRILLSLLHSRPSDARRFHTRSLNSSEKCIMQASSFLSFSCCFEYQLSLPPHAYNRQQTRRDKRQRAELAGAARRTCGPVAASTSSSSSQETHDGRTSFSASGLKACTPRIEMALIDAIIQVIDYHRRVVLKKYTWCYLIDVSVLFRSWAA